MGCGRDLGRDGVRMMSGTYTPLCHSLARTAEHGAAQPTSPAPSWVPWLDMAVLRASPKSGQSTQALHPVAFHSGSVYGLVFSFGGSNLAAPRGGWGPEKCLPT